MYKYLIFTFLSLLSINLQAQDTYPRLSISPLLGAANGFGTSTEYEGIKAEGFNSNMLKGKHLVMQMGILLNYRFNDKYMLSTGFYTAPTRFYFELGSDKYTVNPFGKDTQSHSVSFDTYNIPLLFTYHLKNKQDKRTRFFIQTGASINLYRKNFFDEVTNLRLIGGANSDSFFYKQTFLKQSPFGLNLNVGLGINFKDLRGRERWAFTLTYEKGLIQQAEYNIDYSINDYTSKVKIASRGSWLGLRVSYPIGIKTFGEKIDNKRAKKVKPTRQNTPYEQKFPSLELRPQILFAKGFSSVSETSSPLENKKISRVLAPQIGILIDYRKNKNQTFSTGLYFANITTNYVWGGQINLTNPLQIVQRRTLVYKQTLHLPLLYKQFFKQKKERRTRFFWQTGMSLNLTRNNQEYVFGSSLLNNQKVTAKYTKLGASTYLGFGFNFKDFKGRDSWTFDFAYQQGLIKQGKLETSYELDGVKHSSVISTRGSWIGLKVSHPLRVKTFKKENK